MQNVHPHTGFKPTAPVFAQLKVMHTLSHVATQSVSKNNFIIYQGNFSKIKAIQFEDWQ